jgi:hypothetical protein
MDSWDYAWTACGEIEYIVSNVFSFEMVPFTSEMLTKSEGLIRSSHWTRHPQAVVPAASVYRKRTSTAQIIGLLARRRRCE